MQVTLLEHIDAGPRASQRGVVVGSHKCRGHVARLGKLISQSSKERVPRAADVNGIDDRSREVLVLVPSASCPTGHDQLVRFAYESQPLRAIDFVNRPRQRLEVSEFGIHKDRPVE